MAPLKVAIIGAGIGGEHLAAYRMLPDQFSVVMICDLDEERARSIVAGDQISVSSDLSDVLSNPEIDIVDVCLPPHLHFSTAVAALKAGKHVICEKPLAGSLQEVDELGLVSKQADRCIFPVFQYRFGPAMDQLNALGRAGLAGRPYAASLETHWSRGADYYAVPWRGTWAGEQGGAVLGHAIHNHDLLTHILGPIAELSAFATTRVNDIETEDCAAISFRMESGVVATSSITLGAADDTTRIRVCYEGLTAESGTAPYAPANDVWTFQARDAARQGEIDAVLAGVKPGHFGFAGFFQAIFENLTEGGSRAVTLADGRRSIELVTAIYQSVRNGHSVSLPLTSEAALYTGWLPEKTGVS